MKRTKNKRIDEIKKHLRVQAGLDRSSFFANGGEASRLRGLRMVTVDKKKRGNKLACRGRYRN